MIRWQSIYQNQIHGIQRKDKYQKEMNSINKKKPNKFKEKDKKKLWQ